MHLSEPRLSILPNKEGSTRLTPPDPGSPASPPSTQIASTYLAGWLADYFFAYAISALSDPFLFHLRADPAGAENNYHPI